MSKEEMAFDILAGEADESYYLQFEGEEIAEKPAFMILSNHHPLGHPRKWTLWIYCVDRLLGSKKEVREKLERGLGSATRPMTVYLSRRGGPKKLFRKLTPA